MTSIEQMQKRRPVNRAAVNDHKERMLREVRAHKLRELREATAQTQVDVAQILHVSQNRVSAMERGDIETTRIETLRKYAEALGGKLRVEVEIDGQGYLVA